MNCLIWKMIATAYIWQSFDSSSTLNIDIYSSVTLLASNLLRSAKAHLWGKYIKESSPDWSTYIAVSFMPESSRNLLTCQSLPFFPLNCWSNWFDFRKNRFDLEISTTNHKIYWDNHFLQKLFPPSPFNQCWWV